MSAERQKGDEHHGDGGAGGTRSPEHGRQQAFTAFDQQRALTVSLMEQVCDPKNLLRAYRRVRFNKGKPGVDGMTGPGAQMQRTTYPRTRPAMRLRLRLNWPTGFGNIARR
jgi:hypothetical protein